MKKLVVSTLLVCMLAFSMTACGSEKEDTSAVETEEKAVEEETASEETKEQEKVTTEETSAVIYVNINGNVQEYPCESSDELTAELLISTMSAVTGWNLDLSGKVTTGEDGITVCFAKTSSIFEGMPEKQVEAFAVNNEEELVAAILDSVQYTLQQNFAKVLGNGDPSSVNIYYCMEGNQPLDLSNINKTVPMDQPYTGFSGE